MNLAIRRPSPARHAGTARLRPFLAAASLTSVLAPLVTRRRRPPSHPSITVAAWPGARLATSRPHDRGLAPALRVASRHLQALVAGLSQARGVVPVAQPWHAALRAMVAVLLVLVALLGVEVRRGADERAALRRTLLLEANQAHGLLVEAEEQAAEGRAQLVVLTSRLAAQRRSAAAAEETLRLELARQRAASLWQQQIATAHGDTQSRQLAERQAEIERLTALAAEREADLARLNEHLDALQQRVAQAEALAARIRRAMGIPAPAGPAGGRETPPTSPQPPAGPDPSTNPADVEQRLTSLADRATAATRDLATLERGLSGRLAALRQAAGQGMRLSAEAAAAAPVGKPVPGPVTSGFGLRESPIDGEIRFHHGIDLLANTGTPVRATGAGQVVVAGVDLAFGLVVVVRHEGGFETLYAHNSRLLVRRGQTVERDQVLALAGNSGASSGPHVHYEIHYQGRVIDPTPFLTAK